MTITVYRAADVQVSQFEIDEETVFTEKFMGEHKIVAPFIAISVLPIQIGDYIVHGAERFYVNAPPGVQKINNFTYAYNITFEGERYALYNKLLLDEGAADFSYHGSPEDHLLLLLENINSTQGGWTITEVADLPAKTLTYNADSCRTALTKIAEQFDLEFRIAGRAITMVRSVGVETIMSFSYGRGAGLYSLTRDAIEEKNLVTRVYGFGGRKNLSYDYRNGAKRLTFEERYIDINTDIYGIREGVVTFDDIFPQRTGTVTGINPEDRFQFEDGAMEFDLNEYLLEGTVAKVVFKTGALAGYEFEIERYRDDAKVFNFLEFAEEDDYVLPNDLNFPEVGDEYTLVDVGMPEIYTIEAEQDVKDGTQEYAEENGVPRVTYDLDMDEKYVRETGAYVEVGFIVRIEDTNLAIDNRIRVAEVNYPLVNPDKRKAKIADTIPYTIVERTIADTIDNKTEVVNVDRRRIELARRSAKRFRDLQGLLFDADGYFDGSRIKPNSIETLMLTVGAKSQNFGLIGVSIEANAGGDVNAMNISAGQLAHYEIEIEGLGYVWDVDGAIFTGLDPEKPYYVYAKCASTSLTGVWEISETPRRTTDEVGYYLFNLGVLYAVNEGRRDFDFTNGMTYINGDTITTGRIKSLDGLNFFDLAQGKFKIGNEESSLDYNVTEKGQLTLKGVLVSSMIFAEDAVIENLLVRNLKTRENGRRIEITEAGNNLMMYDEDGNEVLRIDDDIESSGEPPYNAIGGIRTRNPINDRQARMTARGYYADGAGVRTNYGLTSVAGRLLENQYLPGAGVIGTNESGNDINYGVRAVGGMHVAGGGRGLHVENAVHYNVRSVTTSTSVRKDDYTLSCYNQVNIAVLLPPDPYKGRMVLIRRNNSSRISAQGNGNQILRQGLSNEVDVGDGAGDCGLFVFDGSYWLYNVWFR
ncbi:MAG TPA: hypothetical protein ENH91_10265 [Leeuwenhoekiella sp.]|nr:hypothetical protein [Leeuwenhoekiella sp.]